MRDRIEPPAPSAAAARDADICALLAAGDLTMAFDLLMRRYERHLHHLCLALLRRPELASEATQDALVRIWRALPGYNTALGAPSTWMYAITRNRCLTLLAKPGLRVESLSDEDVAFQAEQLISPSEPDNTADNQRVLQQLIGQLPDAQQQCLRLFYFEERQVAEVALMLGQPENTVKTHLHRARANLKQQLQQHGLADPALWLGH
jgi:RNA polymerase sigma-70 factor (ECF subfamily)